MACAQIRNDEASSIYRERKLRAKTIGIRSWTEKQDIRRDKAHGQVALSARLDDKLSDLAFDMTVCHYTSTSMLSRRIS